MLENEVFNRPYVRDITKTCECTCSVTCNPDIITNADRIRAMSDKDLARELALIAEWDRKQLQKAKSGPGLVEFMEHWLQQPAEEDT